MSYVNGYVIPVPESNLKKYTEIAVAYGKVAKEFGALKVFESWEDDVPEGIVTSFPLAVKREPGEKVVFSFIIWPSKEASEVGQKKIMADERIVALFSNMPFDGQRMIWGGFRTIVEL
jgi:uncharacterized protein YbaA (DUF1428 family)